MFYDMLHIHQDFDFQLPLIGDRASIVIDTATGKELSVWQPVHKKEGSFTTKLKIKISGNRLTVEGNPSRYNRIDNLFGYSRIDDCVSVYNEVLRDMGLPEFTPCTRIWLMTGQDGKKARKCSDGAIMTELHVTSNRSVGKGCEDDYLKGLSTLRYRNSIPELKSNGKTVDWKSKKGNAELMYPSVYNKGNEIGLHGLGKIKRAFGEQSEQYKYLLMLQKYCQEQGVVRFEQKLHSKFLSRHDLQFYGLVDEQKFRDLHEEFLNLDSRLQVTAMEIESISDRLIRLGICPNTLSARSTANYALEWMSGKTFDLNKSAVKVARSRLRKLGIDIAEKCDISRHSPVYVAKATEVVVRPLVAPSWYKQPAARHLAMVA